MARLIQPGGFETKVQAAKKKFTLEELQGFVGGYIEVLDHWVPQAGGKKVRVRMVINEEGKLHGLPRNSVATALIGAVLMPGDFIVGTAVVMEQGDSM